uniref:Putative homing endonuclease n=1 Tax=viral metagenome TaxID=1070528 RepID=A0A6M3K7E8_9ZZZZ
MRRINLPTVEIGRRYSEGESLSALGLAYGVNYQTIRRRVVAADVELRGRVRCRNHYFDDGSGYLTTLDRRGKNCRIHRACWEAHYGPIPHGCDIHHLDGNRRHNAPENLACITKGRHMWLHNIGVPKTQRKEA